MVAAEPHALRQKGGAARPEGPEGNMEPLEPSHSSTPPSPEPGRTILLVDDDIELRTAMRDFLTQSGCRVIEARNSYDGLFQCAQYGWAIHLLVTEINLLPVSVIKLAENALRLFPHIQVLCTSACEETRPIRHWMKYLNASFLPKPFSSFDLHEKVHELLGDRWEEAPMPVQDIRPAGNRAHSSNSADPSFWLKDF
jgi:DNA-binding NtrC family response regulator